MDYEQIKPEMAREALRQAELFLQSQLDAAIAADQRATQFAGFCITVTIAAIGGALALTLTENTPWPLVCAGLAIGAIMALATFFCVYAARPSAFFFPGNQPESWIEEEVLMSPESEVLIGQAEHCGSNILFNEAVIDESHNYLKHAMFLAAFSPVVAAIIWLAVTVAWEG